MADNAAKAATMARVLAIVHIIVGTLLVCLGTADLLVAVFWTGYGGFGIWTGFWVSSFVCGQCLFHAEDLQCDSNSALISLFRSDEEIYFPFSRSL